MKSKILVLQAGGWQDSLASYLSWNRILLTEPLQSLDKDGFFGCGHVRKQKKSKWRKPNYIGWAAAIHIHGIRHLEILIGLNKYRIDIHAISKTKKKEKGVFQYNNYILFYCRVLMKKECYTIIRMLLIQSV